MEKGGLEAMLEEGSDNVLVRYALASLFMKQDEPRRAVEHLEIALEQDPGHSASWKLLGRALAACGQLDRAADAYREGIAVAEAKGDLQAAKEMKVFLKRVRSEMSAD